MPIEIPTLAEVEAAAREERLDEVEKVDATAAAEWVEGLQARGLVTTIGDVDLAPELRNLHLIAQVAARLRRQSEDKLHFYAEIVATLAHENGGILQVTQADHALLPPGVLIEEANEDTLTVRFMPRKPAAGDQPS